MEAVYGVLRSVLNSSTPSVQGGSSDLVFCARSGGDGLPAPKYMKNARSQILPNTEMVSQGRTRLK